MEERGIERSIVTYNAAINACANSNEWKRALALLAQVTEDGMVADIFTYNAAINACAKGEQWQKALSLLAEMHADGIKADRVSFNTAIAACAAAQQWTHALDTLHSMSKHGIKPDTLSYNSALNACERGLQWEKAMSLLADMQCAGVRPDVISYSSVISACASSFQWEHAIELFDKMRKGGLEADAVAYSAAISACEKGQQWEQALALLAEMEVLELEDAVAYCAAISACAQVQKWAHAMKLLARMKSRGHPDSVPAFNATMQALVAASRLEDAFDLLERVHASPVVASSYTTHHILLTACRQAGDQRAAKVQAAIHQLKLRSLPAVVKCIINGVEVQHCNGHGSSAALNDATEQLYSRVRTETSYVPRISALPLDFVERTNETQQVASLSNHAEKRALADLLMQDAATLDMRVNFRICDDCHDFLNHAAVLLDRPIHVLEPTRQHIFHST